MARSLERDPQVQSALRDRSGDLGITHLRPVQNVSRAMEHELAQSQSQSLCMER
jgi:hypothetical protein